ncbi:MAG: glutamate--tRNA ligase family protein [Planctomycetota bacterium]
MANAKTVVTRFAPSPTGLLHVGGARTALFAWAYACKHGGQFLLRLEDTDRARSSDAAADAILEDLKWIDLDWDNNGAIPKQSERLDLYNQHLDRLLASGQAYEDGDAIRFRMNNDITFTDAVFGEVTFKADQLEDFIIRKGAAGGFFPTFHFAVVVDDADMGVTHVIRGQEHLNNTPKHIALQRALGFDEPVYAHTASIMNPDGSKMSKRDKAKAARKAATEQSLEAVAGVEDTYLKAFLGKEHDELDVAEAIAETLGLQLPEINVADFRRSGYLPAVLCNYLALLGWSPGDNIERFGADPLSFIKDRFDLDRVGKVNAKFDRDKLFKFNLEALVEMPPEEFATRLAKHLRDYHPAFGTIVEDTDAFAAFCAAVQERSRTLEEVAQQNRFFVCDDSEITYDATNKGVKKAVLKNDGEGLKVLRGFRSVLEAIDDWTAPALHAAVEGYATEQGLKNMGSVAQPLRVALTGAPVSPPIDLTLQLMGKAATLRRIDNCLFALETT